jgi:CO/xanthine dehydrogenase Mo-binding subunit
MPESKVRVVAFPMGGCFGDGAQYYDTAQAAALMSQAVGAPVRVQLMRWDEISWGSSAPGSLVDVKAGIDAKGNLAPSTSRTSTRSTGARRCRRRTS